DEGHAIDFTDIEYAAYVGMRDLTGDAHLAMEARQGCAVLHQLLRKELQRHILIELQILGAIDLAHLTASDERHDAIAVGKQSAGKDASAFAAKRGWPDSA